TENGQDLAVRTFLEVRQRIQESPTKANAAHLVAWLRTQMGDIRLVPGPEGEGLFCYFSRTRRGLPGYEGTFRDFFLQGWEELDEDDRLHEIPAAVRDQLPEGLTGQLAEMMNFDPDEMLELVPWGELRVESPPRSRSILGKFMKKWKATEEGVFPRFPHRYFLDGQIFARRRKIPGGTVVIDASGSMSLSGEEIQAMVECAPGCLVACYSGTGDGGVLRILAEGGKRVADEFCLPPDGEGNIVDFPVLKWAYKQSHPRIWVSDLVVTGVEDQEGSAN